MKIMFLGGACEVGASCVLLKTNDENILMDCGIRQGNSKDPLPDFRTIQEYGGVDAIVISHAHLDHIGTLPIISKEYPNAKIYMNNMTKDLVRVLLYDSLKIMNNREAEIPLYAEIDVENMLNRVFTINYEVEFEILEDIKLTLYNAGHIAGASCVYLKTKEGAVFYSGDFSVFSQKSVEGAKLPRLRPDIGIFESTYGDKLHSNREIEEQRLIEIANKCIDKEGKMIIPAFALGRAQEIILILKKAMNKGSLKKVNVYVDGMVKNINAAYKHNPLYLKNSLGKKILRGIEPFYDDYIKAISNKKERENIIEAKESCIIVSSSGMLTGGPSQLYAEKLAAGENNYIVITGYQDEEAPGRKLLNLLEKNKEDRILEINGRSMPVRCDIQLVGLSAHADKGEIKSIIDRLTPKNTFLVHGDEKVVKRLAGELIGEVRSRIYAPKSGEVFDIDIRNKRKQLKRQFSYVLSSNEQLNRYNVDKLWNYVRENYEGKLFTIEELVYIWYGEQKNEWEDLKDIQKLIVGSIYFESDIQRLFMFKAQTKEKVEEALSPRELKQNEINDIMSELFDEYGYKKAGLKINDKTAILNFDFPKVIADSIYEKMKEFKEQTSWNIKINESTNINAAENIIRSLLKEADIKKISYNIQQENIKVILNSTYKLKDEKEKFKKVTGLSLEINQAGEKNEIQDKDLFIVNDNKDKMEQNTALNLIDNVFTNKEFKPYKKSIKSNCHGKYIELSFISPIIGKRYMDNIKLLSKEIGWAISISKAVNQNAIINLAIRLCSEVGIKLKKNPSFNPTNLCVTIKSDNIDEEKFHKVKESFNYETGCKLII
ncbi:MBL fold metallo-hydrolase [Clostridium aestuarii]|uniref:MBL fold metallo-hydrolase n=1 Tax=Clostridium aestuarii TaxID=338193 RepID=A0ABT4CZB8_9CLOT|nr:MBL fold metallo-hydrolase RNA specificity domain-containing protein [Clostridium aestuarii]MCY6484331.1 MBL fold metallo-hydrolase [Clostridium aestuarii]